jgi:hypothetical protein
MAAINPIMERTLAVHNALRAAHGSPPLEWSDECAQYAQMQADSMAAAGSIGHDNMDQPSGRAGQNVAMNGASMSDEEYAENAIKMWYNEVNEPGYHYFDSDMADSPDMGVLHFTQVVWAETTHVGLAVKDGYTCANYLPGGNMMMPGEFPKNVMASSQGTDFDAIVAGGGGAEEEEEEEEDEEEEDDEDAVGSEAVPKKGKRGVKKGGQSGLAALIAMITKPLGLTCCAAKDLAKYEDTLDGLGDAADLADYYTDE